MCKKLQKYSSRGIQNNNSELVASTTLYFSRNSYFYLRRIRIEKDSKNFVTEKEFFTVTFKWYEMKEEFSINVN